MVAERIKIVCAAKKISVAKMLSECAIAKNTIGNLSAGHDLTLSNAYKIADYLGVSVDYLLGRNDTPDDIDAKLYGRIKALPKDTKEWLLDTLDRLEWARRSGTPQQDNGGSDPSEDSESIG